MSAVRTGSPGAFSEIFEINESLASAFVFAFQKFYDGWCHLTFKLPLFLQGLHLDLEKVQELCGI